MRSCLIVDDEPKARILLRTIIEKYCPDLTIVGECNDVPSAVKAIRKSDPELIFLDIEMPGYSGLELFDFFKEDEINFHVIFTTAYNDYAIQAFKVSAIDYLLKPIHHVELCKAVKRFIERGRTPEPDYKKLNSLFAAENLDDKRLVVATSQALKYINPADIVLIKAEAAYSEILLSSGSKLLASRNLKHFEEALSDVPFFFRSHKSYLVNLRMIEEYVRSDGGYLRLKGNHTASISSEKVEEFTRRMK